MFQTYEKKCFKPMKRNVWNLWKAMANTLSLHLNFHLFPQTILKSNLQSELKPLLTNFCYLSVPFTLTFDGRAIKTFELLFILYMLWIISFTFIKNFRPIIAISAKLELSHNQVLKNLQKRSKFDFSKLMSVWPYDVAFVF